MANPLTMASLDLANHVQGGIWQKNVKGGIIASLAPKAQLMVGNTDMFTFTSTPKAEMVGEGANKGSAEYTPTTVTAKTYKFQLTYRFTDELKWADEDYKIGILNSMTENIATATSRALDLVAIHGINPATGTVAAQVAKYLTKTGSGVANATDLEAAAQALQTEGYIATGIAFDPVYAGELAREKDDNGRQLYPELGFGFGFNNYRGLSAASSNTISGREEITYSTGNKMPQAIMADFDALKWGVARNIPLEVIETGDPDGKGDLKRNNQIAIRAEVVLGFAIMDPKAFAIVSKTVA